MKADISSWKVQTQFVYMFSFFIDNSVIMVQAMSILLQEDHGLVN